MGKSAAIWVGPSSLRRVFDRTGVTEPDWDSRMRAVAAASRQCAARTFHSRKREMTGRAFESWRSEPKSMRRELKPEEHEEIVNAVTAGDRIKATSIYLSATGGNLTDAQNFVRSLTEERLAKQASADVKG